MKLPTFWGGIHPPQNKDLTADEKIEYYLPTGELVFPMPQNIGAPNAPVVAKGDRVLVGTRLGNNDAFVSAPVLSSVSGTVKAVCSCRPWQPAKRDRQTAASTPAAAHIQQFYLCKQWIFL